MNSQLSDLIVAALATWQIVEVWHHSLLLSRPRSWAEVLENKLGELLCCPWCLSVWTGMLCAGLQTLPEPYGFFSRWVVYGFAVSRLANLGNDVFHGVCRTPRFTLPLLPDPQDDERDR